MAISVDPDETAPIEAVLNLNETVLLSINNKCYD